MKRLLAILLSILMVVCAFAGCTKEEVAYDFIYPFSANVNSYDPQVASTGDEFLIIENCFEGLIRVNDDGKVVKGVADKWEVSQDGLKYTFHIKRGTKWDINTDKYESGEKKGKFKDKRLEMLKREFNPDITAKDFVFALQRASLPITNCPTFSLISNIKGATEIHSGKAEASTLGVKAIDDYTLQITLKTRDDNFMSVLASAVAMPCNEEFFNATKGRYGLESKYTLYNGQFYVSQILETSYLLKKNKQYTGPHPTKAKELTLKIIKADEDKKDIIPRLESGYYDAAFISGSDSDVIKKDSGVNYTSYKDTTWAFVLNTNDEVLQSKLMRKAFCEGFTRPESYEKEYLSPATNLTPASCLINSNLATKAMKETITKQNQEQSVKDWQKALTIVDTTNVEINILTPERMQNTVKEIIQGIQSGIGTSLKNKDGDIINLTLKVEVSEDNKIKSAIARGDYDIAFLPFKAESSSAIDFVNKVIENNGAGINQDKVIKHITNAQNETNLNSVAKNLEMAENEIIKSYSICPMVYESSYYALAKGVNNVQFHPGTGRVSFVNATRNQK